MSNGTKKAGDVPEWIAKLFRDSYNTLHGTDYIEDIPEEQHTDADMRLLDTEGNLKEEIQHLSADPDWLHRHSAIAFYEIGGTLQEVVDNSGVKKDFVLSVHTTPRQLPEKKPKRVKLVKNLWDGLERRIEELKKAGVKKYKFDYFELLELCGEHVADAFTGVSIYVFDKEFERNVVGPGVTYWVRENWVPELTSEAVLKKTGKNYSNPEDLILLVELQHVPPSKMEDVNGIREALRNTPPVFKEVWIVSGFLGEAVRVWTSFFNE